MFHRNSASLLRKAEAEGKTDRKQDGRPETAYKKAESLVATYGANLKFYSILTLNECVIFVQFQECFS